MHAGSFTRYPLCASVILIEAQKAKNEDVVQQGDSCLIFHID